MYVYVSVPLSTVMLTNPPMLLPSPSIRVPLNLTSSNTVTSLGVTFNVIVAFCLSAVISVNSVGLFVFHDAIVTPVLFR